MDNKLSQREHPITLLAVPYAEREQAKSIGARWNPTKKLFYINSNDVGTKIPKQAIERWLPKKVTNRNHDSLDHTNAIHDFANAIRDAGLLLDGLPVMDGKFHQVPTINNKRSRKSGSYIGFLDGIPAGFITNFQSGLEMPWSQKNVRLTPEERLHLKVEFEAAKLEREKEKELLQEKVAKRSTERFQSLPTQRPESCYLDRKKVGAHHIRFEDSTVVVPMQDINGRIWSLLRILNRPDDNKRNSKDGRKDGLFHIIGEIKPNQPILFSEGYATSASIHEATGYTVVTTFSHNNMDEVLRLFKQKYPDNPLLVAADDDRALEDNPGLTNAKLASEKHGAGLFLPSFSRETTGTDFNDLHVEEGLEVVKQQINKAVADFLAEQHNMTKIETPSIEPLSIESNLSKSHAEKNEVIEVSDPLSVKLNTTNPQLTNIISPEKTPETTPTTSSDARTEEAEPTNSSDATSNKAAPEIKIKELITELQLPPEELTIDSDDQGSENTQDTSLKPKSLKPEIKTTSSPALEFEQNGFVPVEADSEKPKVVEPYDLKSILEGVTYKTQNDGSVLYMVDQTPAFVDHGQQILMVKKSSKEDKHILGAMLLAQEKFGNAFQLTGSDEFKRKAIQLMIENKIEVKLKDPAQLALKKEIEKTLQQQKEKPEIPPDEKPSVFIGKPALEESTPLNKNIIAIPALELWQAQNDFIENLNEEEKQARLERLGPPPNEEQVYWFDEYGSLSTPPENPERYLSKPIQIDGFKLNFVPLKVIEGKAFYEGNEQTTVQLFKGEGNYFYGQVMDGNQPRFVIATMTKRPADPQTGEIKPNFIKLMSIQDGKLQEIGYGNAVNTRNDGKQNTFDEVLLKVGPRILRSKVCNDIDSEIHKKLGFLEQVRRPQDSPKKVDLSSSQAVKPTQTQITTQPIKPELDNATQADRRSFLKRLRFK